MKIVTKMKQESVKENRKVRSREAREEGRGWDEIIKTEVKV